MAKLNPLHKHMLAGAMLALLAGCGGTRDIPAASTIPMQQNPSQMTEIMSTLKELQSDVAILKQNQNATPAHQSNASGSAAGKTAVAAKPSAGKTAAPVTAKPGAPKLDAKTEAKPETKTEAKPDAKAQGRQQLDLVLKSITGVNGFDAVVNKHEVGVQNGKTSDAKIRITGANPHRVRIEILQHESKKGLKVAYSGGASQINIRPNGMLSMISVSKPMNDPLVLSSNGQKPDEVDFYAMAKRMANAGYQAELIGKSTVNGKQLHILKVTAPGGNTLFSQISHEYIGFDPSNNQLLLWEAYSTSYQGGNQPFLRMSVDKFDALSSVSDQQLAI